MTTLGILAGSGEFPFLVAQGAKSQGMRVVACGFTNNTDPALAEHVDAFTIIPLGKLNTLISFFKKHGVTKACMAGAINKPKALDIKPDFRAAKLLFRLAKSKGDDAILRTVMQELQSEGFAFVRPDQYAPVLQSPQGILTTAALSTEVWQDIYFGWQAAKQIGSLDIGQCVIVKSGIIVAVEAIEGTDATIERAGLLAGAGCTVVKTSKPHQDERLDLPSIGEKTVQLLTRHKFNALAYEAGKTLFFQQEASLSYANANSLAIIGLPQNPVDFFAKHLQ